MADKPEVERIVREVLEDVFGVARIGDLHIVRDLGWQGDEVLRIHIAINDPYNGFNAGLGIGVTRRLRNRLLDELDDDAFPITSYVTNSDMKTIKNAVG